uniref:LAGLIDADG endonuclease n=1 Tax=Monilinia fructicola TaxID=38448 RepID=A0A8F8SS69_MONFR|nr:LAGLIDADG endonuclease [Monilinia fructicola]QYB19467.1 LAGLIDADG endonuclease [Monilinia fructicola]QYB19529.1 LAGLIDADG endonuclease [Monilinia fructicola]QYB19591.1 LAGLIDADG endonuclease [Monilinia fructicola]QYB19653.1 LAGLIDADG endonuclease [Monilinia fructicola]
MTYYVVAQMGQNNLSSIKNYFATDYMLETIFFVYCLLFINTFYLYKLDVSRINFLLNSQNNDTTISSKFMNIQSAENCKGFSETARQLPDIGDYKFWNWFAGIIDGDGNFDIRLNSLPPLRRGHGNKRVLKQIRIKLHNRDIRILKRIQDYLHMGRIIRDKNKPYSIYIVSTKETMMYILKNINGLIRLKVPGFKEACNLYNIDYIEANYNLGLYDPYFAGLVDTDGSLVFNYAGNRIECNLEFQNNEYTSKLNFDNTILNCKPTIIKRKRSSGLAGSKDLTSIAFKFQSVNNMLFIYDYFMHNRLYCDMKFYRVTKIKPFLEIRKYKTFPINSVEHKIYSDFMIDWIKYDNPLWYKVPFVNKYLLYKDK